MRPDLREMLHPELQQGHNAYKCIYNLRQIADKEGILGIRDRRLTCVYSHVQGIIDRYIRDS